MCSIFSVHNETIHDCVSSKTENKYMIAWVDWVSKFANWFRIMYNISLRTVKYCIAEASYVNKYCSYELLNSTMGQKTLKKKHDLDKTQLGTCNFD